MLCPILENLRSQQRHKRRLKKFLKKQVRPLLSHMSQWNLQMSLKVMHRGLEIQKNLIRTLHQAQRSQKSKKMSENKLLRLLSLNQKKVPKSPPKRLLYLLENESRSGLIRVFLHQAIVEPVLYFFRCNLFFVLQSPSIGLINMLPHHSV